MKRAFRESLVYISMFVAIGWWGIWYPELTEAAGAYEVVCEESAVQTPEEMVECGLDETTYREWLKTDSEQVRFRFRIWEWIENYWNKG